MAAVALSEGWLPRFDRGWSRLRHSSPGCDGRELLPQRTNLVTDKVAPRAITPLNTGHQKTKDFAMKEIDARGLACPVPVLHTKATLQEEKPSAVQVTVDNAASQQNVQRFLESQGFETSLERQGGDYIVIGRCGTAPEPAVRCRNTRSGFEEDHGHVRHGPYGVRGRRTRPQADDKLPAYAEGDGTRIVAAGFRRQRMKLSIEGSEVLDNLKAYEKAGLKIMVCGTCLNHFKLLEKKMVGETTNMLDIVTAMQLADKVVNL